VAQSGRRSKLDEAVIGLEDALDIVDEAEHKRSGLRPEVGLGELHDSSAQAGLHNGLELGPGLARISLEPERIDAMQSVVQRSETRNAVGTCRTRQQPRRRTVCRLEATRIPGAKKGRER